MHSKKKYNGDKAKDCHRDLIFLYKNKYGGQYLYRQYYLRFYKCTYYMNIIIIINVGIIWV